MDFKSINSSFGISILLFLIGAAGVISGTCGCICACDCAIADGGVVLESRMSIARRARDKTIGSTEDSDGGTASISGLVDAWKAGVGCEGAEAGDGICGDS